MCREEFLARECLRLRLEIGFTTKYSCNSFVGTPESYYHYLSRTAEEIHWQHCKRERKALAKQVNRTRRGPFELFMHLPLERTCEDSENRDFKSFLVSSTIANYFVKRLTQAQDLGLFHSAHPLRTSCTLHR
jgi:hypothetical protein